MRSKMPDNVSATLFQISKVAREQPRHRFNDIFKIVADPALLDYSFGLICGVRTKRPEWFRSLPSDLTEGLFEFGPVVPRRRPKPKGGYRTIVVPTEKDRVVSTALRLVLEAVLDYGFSPDSFGFRRGMGTEKAQRAIAESTETGLIFAVSLDIKAFFDSVPHNHLLQLLNRHISDKHFLRLTRSAIRAPQKIGNHLKPNTKGIHQGHPLSPILANLFLDQFDRAFRQQTDAGVLTSRCVRYADDIILLGPDLTAIKAALAWSRMFVEQKLQMTLHDTTDLIRDLREPDAIPAEFLGLTVHLEGNGKVVWGISTEKITAIVDQFGREVTRPPQERKKSKKRYSPEQLADRFVREHRDYYQLVQPETLAHLDFLIRAEFTRRFPKGHPGSISSVQRTVPMRQRCRVRSVSKCNGIDLRHPIVLSIAGQQNTTRRNPTQTGNVPAPNRVGPSG